MTFHGVGRTHFNNSLQNGAALDFFVTHGCTISNTFSTPRQSDHHLIGGVLSPGTDPQFTAEPDSPFVKDSRPHWGSVDARPDVKQKFDQAILDALKNSPNRMSVEDQYWRLIKAIRAGLDVVPKTMKGHTREKPMTSAARKQKMLHQAMEAAFLVYLEWSDKGCPDSTTA